MTSLHAARSGTDASAASWAGRFPIAAFARALGVALAAVALHAGQDAFAHGGAHADGAAKGKPKFVVTEAAFGRAIPPSQTQRTLRVDMSDAMRFTPAEIRVKRGERVRIVVRNSGEVLHEMVLGTREELEKHAELMRRFPDMEHDEPFMAHVDPGKTGEIAWQFTKAGEFFYGCLVPGHFEAGMFGRIIVVP